MPTALVTGGAGFIGSNLVRLLVSEGLVVRVVDNLVTGYRENLAGVPVEFVVGDVRDAVLVERMLQGVGLVFHLAASVGNVRSVEDPRVDADVNVLGTVTVLEAARKAGVKRFIYSSSAATFGELLSDPISENHPQNPDSPYGVSKLSAEKYVLCYGRLYGLRVTCLRYFNAYGVKQRYDAYGNVIPIFADRLLSGKPLTIYGDGEQTRDFVNVSDIVRVNYLAAGETAPFGEVYNVGCGTAITINQLADLIQQASGIQAAAVVHAPPRPSEVRHCRADIRKLKGDLGFEPMTDLRDGLRDYFDWFRCDALNCRSGTAGSRDEGKKRIS